MKLAMAVAGLVLLAGVLLAWRAPRPRYERREHMVRVSAFWHADEAFVFLDTYGEARRHLDGLERWPASFQAFAWQAGWEESRSAGTGAMAAYRVTGTGVQRFDLGPTPPWLRWELTDDGRLQGAPRRAPYGERTPAPGFRWNGTDFTRLPPEGPAPTETRTLRPEEEEVEEDPEGSEGGPVPEDTKSRMKEAGWKYRVFSPGEAAGGPVELPMEVTSGAAVLHLSQLDASSPEERRQHLELRTPRVREALLEAGIWQPMDAAAFDRLPSHLPPGAREHPVVLLARLYLALLPVLCVLMMGWLAMAGPVRALKIGVLFFLGASALATALVMGPDRALFMFAAPLALGVLALPVSTLAQRYTTRRALAPAEESACPGFGRARLRSWTAGFEAAGFRGGGDWIHAWRMFGRERRTFVRLLRHESGEAIAMMAFNDGPRFEGRALTSLVGRAPVVTCDRLSNQELLADGATLTLRVPRGATCAEMAAAHLAFARQAGAPRVVDDAAGADAEAWETWTRGLLESGQAVPAGETFRISVLAAFGASVRLMRGWLQ